jgi:hypothetical protein
MKMMLAARLHQVGGEMILERLPVPEPRSTDVLVEVKACGLVPNLRNVLANWQTWFPELPLPKLPAADSPILLLFRSKQTEPCVCRVAQARPQPH